MTAATGKNTTLLLFLYLGCGLLVVTFVNLYPLYDHLVRNYGLRAVSFFPYLPPVMLLTMIGALCLSRSRKVRWRFFLPGVLLLALALFIPDPEISVKRIHVSEYLVLSLITRYTMSLRLSGRSLPVFATLFAAILGIHDEFLQGIHPARTYGLRDMLVNAVAATGGGFLWHSLSFFSLRESPGCASRPGKTGNAIHYCYLGWLALAIVAMIVPLMAFRHTTLPFWPCLPLVAAVVFRACLPQGDAPEIRHGIMVLSAASFLLLLYPVVVNGWQLAFF